MRSSGPSKSGSVSVAQRLVLDEFSDDEGANDSLQATPMNKSHTMNPVQSVIAQREKMVKRRDSFSKSPLSGGPELTGIAAKIAKLHMREQDLTLDSQDSPVRYSPTRKPAPSSSPSSFFSFFFTSSSSLKGILKPPSSNSFLSSKKKSTGTRVDFEPMVQIIGVAYDDHGH
jgi:hypothetical protein